MKNVTLSAEEHLIEQARQLARTQRETLNQVFREWLLQYTARQRGTRELDALMQRLGHVHPGQHFTRDELNAR